MDFKDYYSTLGVPKTATEKEIKQAYRKLARKHHPDVNPGDKSAEAKFKEINEAYEVLGDPEKRKKYDELGANWRHVRTGRRAGGRAPVRSQAAWNVNFGGGGPGGGFRTMTEEEMREMFGDGDPFSDFFHTFFGGARAPRSRGAAGRGGGAAGPAPGARRRAGDRARPRGRVPRHHAALVDQARRPGAHRRRADSGRRRRRLARARRRRRRARAPAARRPATCTCGSGSRRIRQFERKGKDLYTRVPIPLTTAVLGGEAEVPTLGGKSLRLKIPPTTQNGQVFRLKGHGMPAVGKPDERGDLYATVDVQLPKQLTPEQREHFEELRSWRRDRKLRLRADCELSDPATANDRAEARSSKLNWNCTMNINKYTEKAQEAVAGAQRAGRSR